MRFCPFLSHKRQDRRAVRRLKRELLVRGAGGWQDVDDLRAGEDFPDQLERAINRDTGGFIWFGTRRILRSATVNEIEVPLALERHKRDPSYRVMPVFAKLSPDNHRPAIEAALGADRAGTLLRLQGMKRERREPMRRFIPSAARAYVAAVARELPARPLIAMTAFREPTDDAHLTFDWRPLFDQRHRRLRRAVSPTIVEALSDVREALQSQHSAPEAVLIPHLPLPLAFLVGYEWRITTGLRLSVEQRTGQETTAVEGDGPANVQLPEPTVMEYPQSRGPVVLAVSCNTALTEPLLAYAKRVGAGRTLDLHVPGLLDAAGIRTLARRTARLLKQLNNEGVAKHLLLLGPVSLAVLAGAAANAAGPTTLPFWSHNGFDASLVAGEQ